MVQSSRQTLLKSVWNTVNPKINSTAWLIVSNNIKYQTIWLKQNANQTRVCNSFYYVKPEIFSTENLFHDKIKHETLYLMANDQTKWNGAKLQPDWGVLGLYPGPWKPGSLPGLKKENNKIWTHRGIFCSGRAPGRTAGSAVQTEKWRHLLVKNIIMISARICSKVSGVR
jgi:hypothetical protein